MAKKKETAAAAALRKLRRKGRGSAADKLAVLAVDDLMATPMEELAPADEVAERVVAVLAGLAATENLDALVRERVAWVEGHLADERGKVGDALNDGARGALDDLLGAPYAMDPEHTLKALDHEAMRGLVRFGSRSRDTNEPPLTPGRTATSATAQPGGAPPLSQKTSA